MKGAYFVAAGLLVVLGAAHSYLGERYILMRLFRLELPKLFGGTAFTKATLRFAWHLTTVGWIGFAALMCLAASPELDTGRSRDLAMAATFAVSGIVSLIGSKGRHLSWIVFFLVSALMLIAAL